MAATKISLSNDNQCPNFHPEAHCAYPLCDNTECEEKQNCCIYMDYEMYHDPYEGRPGYHG